MDDKPVNYVVENDRKKRYYKRQKLKRRKRNFTFSILFLTVLGITIFTCTFINSPSAKAGDSQISSETTENSSKNNIIDNQNINSTPDNEKKTIDQGKLQEPTPIYDYSKPVSKSSTVENSYFDDAVFIGDSRTEGLILNTGLSNAISYTHKGLMVDTVFTTPVIDKNGCRLSIMTALKTTTFSKVYIMLGINETGWPYSSIFIEKYGQIIDEIKRINPSASIYVQEIIPVTNHISSTHRYVKNEKISEYNKLIQTMASEKQIYYIDTATAVSDFDGSLPEEATMDGIHLKKDYCEKWLNYLKTHTILEGVINYEKN